MLNKLIDTLSADRTLKSATYYESPKRTVRVTRHSKRMATKRDRYAQYVVSIGQPNYLARAFIKLALKAKEPFPIKKIQLKHYPVKKKK